jgi:hypothetical protein
MQLLKLAQYSHVSKRVFYLSAVKYAPVQSFMSFLPAKPPLNYFQTTSTVV